MRRRTAFGLMGLGVVGGLFAIVFGPKAEFDPDFCQKRCPICTRAREGNRVAGFLQQIEMAVTGGGCPWGRARQKKYGVRPDQPLVEKQPG